MVTILLSPVRHAGISAWRDNRSGSLPTETGWRCVRTWNRAKFHVLVQLAVTKEQHEYDLRQVLRER